MTGAIKQKKREPIFNNMPTGVLIIGVIMVTVEAYLQIFGLETRSVLIMYFSFVPKLFLSQFQELYFGDYYFRFFSHAFLHGDFFHMLLNVVVLIAVGKHIEENLGLIKFLIIFFISAISGALFFQVIESSQTSLLFGASSSVYGLLAFFFGRDFFVRLKNSMPIQPVINIAVLMILVHIPLILWGPLILGAEIGWQGHLGGAISGFLLIFFIKEVKAK